MAHHEPLGARPLVVAAAGCHPNLFDPQVVGHVVVAAGAGQRGGGLGVGVAQLLGVDVVPAAAGEVGAVGGGGEPGVGDPHQPVQVPGSQVVLDRADDPLVALAAGKGPAAHRDSVAGDRHRDHHLGQVVAMVLGLAEPARGPLDRFGGAVVGLGFGRQVGQLVGHVDLPVGGGGVDEDDVDIEVEQVRDRVEDPRGDLAQRVEQEVHRPIRRVVGKPGAAGDRDPFGDPAGGGQLAARFQRPLRHQREQHPLGRVRVQAPVGGDPVQRRADAQPLPELVEQPRPAEAARVQDLDLAGVRGRDRLLRVEEPRDRGDQPGQRVAVHGLGAAEVVDHLRRGHPGDRVAFAVRQLQIRHRRPVAVAPLRLPQVHPYTVSTYPLVRSSDTPELVCLHEFAVWVTPQASYQHNRSALPRNVPTNCGSRGWWVSNRPPCNSSNGVPLESCTS